MAKNNSTCSELKAKDEGCGTCISLDRKIGLYIKLDDLHVYDKSGNIIGKRTEIVTDEIGTHCEVELFTGSK